MTQGSTRRTVLATGAAALVAAGCGNTSSSGNSETSPSPETSHPSQTPPAAMAASPSTGTAAAGRVLASTGDIPEGGGMVFTRAKVVVTQPKKGEFKAFSAVCTHQNCTVSRVADGTIHCPCHGSRFRIADGSVAHGPATRPLPAEPIKVEGNSISLT
ncbi:Rieske (2Fe-2S) protein [Streptomyces kebangsaanensis]|uniref:Rieske (2Fe-2S) protein n=1 Tax=Streptomyces kebangsaanensis TaxID=864058 RepID=UPI00093EBA20|nr:Rieske (2Fe-2S) protein [Streptomyces kebangsaanensis]